MTKNPLLNAGAAAAYIGAVVLFISSLGDFENQGVETLFIPLFMISLVVFSVLMMAYCFFFQPVQMFLDGQKKEAVSLFSKSVLYFGAIVVALFGVMLYSIQAGIGVQV